MNSAVTSPAKSWEQLLNVQVMEKLDNLWAALVDWFREDTWDGDTLTELAVVVPLLAVSFFGARWLRGRLQRHWQDKPASTELGDKLRHRFLQLLFPLLALAFLWPLDIYTNSLGIDNDFIDVMVNVIQAWVVIQFLASLLFQPFWARIFATVVWLVAALNILDLLPLVTNFLSSITFDIGQLKVSLLSILESFFLFVILIRAGIGLGTYLQQRLAAAESLESSTRTLLGVIGKILLFVVSAIVCLDLFGVDMSMFTVFSGALGFGLGIGLRAVFGNLVAGVIIMLDKSVKVGDVIRIDEVYGEVTKLSALFTLLLTRDGLEYMIPNEDLISRRIVSSSYSSRDLRLRAPIGIAYGSDVDKAMKLAEQAAKEAKRVLPQKPPQCRLTGLGDSAINLELRFWIKDPENGITNVKTQVLCNVLKLFKEHGVDIPFPQQDLHIKQLPDGLTPA